MAVPGNGLIMIIYYLYETNNKINSERSIQNH
jgi:hypothetical protein